MTLNEWIKANGDKEVVFEEDGKFSVKEPEKHYKRRPNVGREYWHLNLDELVRVGSSYWKDDLWDEARYEIGNVYRTEEEAEAAVERMKIRFELIDCGGKEVYRVPIKPIYVFNCDLHGNLQVDCTMMPDLGTIYFDSTEQVHDAITRVGEDRIKRYMFGVEEY